MNRSKLQKSSQVEPRQHAESFFGTSDSAVSKVGFSGFFPLLKRVCGICGTSKIRVCKEIFPLSLLHQLMLCLHMFTYVYYPHHLCEMCCELFCELFCEPQKVTNSSVHCDSATAQKRFEKGRSDLTKKTVKVPAIGLGKSPGRETDMPSHAKTCAMTIKKIKQNAYVC